MLRKAYLLLFMSISFCAINLVSSCGTESGSSQTDLEFEKELQTIFDSLPEPIGLVNDFEELLAAEEESLLVHSLLDLKSKHGCEIVVVTTSSVSPLEEAVLYASAIGNKWGVGSTEDGGGMVVVLSAANSQTAIATGMGLENVFSDSVTDMIINNHMIPNFKHGEYYLGIKEAIGQFEIIATIKSTRN